ncbi:universal stress protein [Nocardioides sp. NPDC047086]|uniref:universal stress protein n=1 Tax=Nocardioides sp. NPDC047086 TaxID=3154810 RepID=UPI0033C3408A
MTYEAIIPDGAVVVGVESWPAAAESVAWAAEQAFRDGRDVGLFHVVPASTLDTPPGFRAGAPSEPDQDYGASVLEQARAHADRRLDKLSRASGFLGHRRPAVSVELETGSAARALDAASRHASLLVLGSRGRGPIRSRILGSVSRSTVKDARCPVVVLRPGEGGVGRGVLVGIDGTGESAPALEFGFAQAAQRNLPVTVLYCYRVHGAERREADRLLAAESVAGLQERYPDLHPRVRIEAGSLAHALAEQSRTMHMVVVGTGGGVAWHLLDHAHSVIAVVPSALSHADISPPATAV